MIPRTVRNIRFFVRILLMPVRALRRDMELPVISDDYVRILLMPVRALRRLALFHHSLERLLLSESY